MGCSLKYSSLDTQGPGVHTPFWRMWTFNVKFRWRECTPTNTDLKNTHTGKEGLLSYFLAHCWFFFFALIFYSFRTSGQDPEKGHIALHFIQLPQRWTCHLVAASYQICFHWHYKPDCKVNKLVGKLVIMCYIFNFSNCAKNSTIC